MKFLDQFFLHFNSTEAASHLIVFPSNRAVFAFKECLKKKRINERGYWLPECVTLSEFLETFNYKTIASVLDKIDAMYGALNKVLGEQSDFKINIDLISQLISDFDEVKREGVDPNVIFKEVSYVKIIEKWDLNKDDLGAIGEKNLTFWKKLILLFEYYELELKNKQVVHQKQVIERIIEDAKFNFFIEKKLKIWFVGFNNFNNSERFFIEYIGSKTDVEIVFDFDQYYLKNNSDKAGIFLNNQLKKVTTSYTVLDAKWEAQKQAITHAQLDGNLAQITYLFQQLENSSKDEKIGVLFLDQNLVQTTLSNLPDSLKNINLGVGVRLEYTFCFQLITDLLNTNQVLEFDYLKNNFRVSENWVISLRDEIEKENSLKNKINLIEKTLVDLIDFNPKNPFDIFRQEAVKSCAIFIQDFNNQIESVNHLNDAILQAYFLSELAKISINTISNKNAQIQFLGLLETRAIDFDTVYLISFNENYLPGKLHSKSIIPLDLRNRFQLSTPNSVEGLKSYYFYQSIQRAKNIHFLSVRPNIGFNGSEPSRYIYQLNQNHINFKKQMVNCYQIERRSANAIAKKNHIKNTKEIQLKVENYITQKGISASALNLLVRNPFDFYMQYGLGLKTAILEQDTVLNSELGTLFHEVLESIYTPFVNTILTNKILDQIQSSKNAELTTHLNRLKDQLNLSDGTLSIYKNIVSIWLNNFLKFEKKRIKNGTLIKLIGLEVPVSKTVTATIKSKKIKIKFSGIIDRIEEIEGEINLIDYKTGRVEQKDLRITSISNVLSDQKFSKALQLLFYTYMSIKTDQKVFSSIYSCRNHKAGILNLNYSENTGILPLDDFEKKIIEKITELFSSEFIYEECGEYPSRFLNATV